MRACAIFATRRVVALILRGHVFASKGRERCELYEKQQISGAECMIMSYGRAMLRHRRVEEIRKFVEYITKKISMIQWSL